MGMTYKHWKLTGKLVISHTKSVINLGYTFIEMSPAIFSVNQCKWFMIVYTILI